MSAAARVTKRTIGTPPSVNAISLTSYSAYAKTDGKPWGHVGGRQYTMVDSVLDSNINWFKKPGLIVSAASSYMGPAETGGREGNGAGLQTQATGINRGSWSRLCIATADSFTPATSVRDLAYCSAHGLDL